MFVIKDKTNFVVFEGTLEQCNNWLKLWSKRTIKSQGYVVDVK